MPFIPQIALSEDSHMLINTYFKLIMRQSAKQVNQQSCHRWNQSTQQIEIPSPFTAAFSYGGRPATVQAILRPLQPMNHRGSLGMSDKGMQVWLLTAEKDIICSRPTPVLKELRPRARYPVQVSAVAQSTCYTMASYARPQEVAGDMQTCIVSHPGCMLIC